MKKIIVAGPRVYMDWLFVQRKLDELIQEPCIIVCGQPEWESVDRREIKGLPSGVDLLGKKWATIKGYEVAHFPADWDKHGKAAGPIRNREMAMFADELIAFWNGAQKGSGTYNMINTMELYKKPVIVINI